MLVHQPVEGGVARHVSDLGRGLSRAGHEVIVCGPAPPMPPPEGCRHVLLAMDRAVSPAADLRAVRGLRRLVDRLAPDLVHAHSSKAGAVARLARLGAPRLPVVYSPHGFAFAGHFDRGWEREVYRQLERSLSPLASRVICVCEAEADLARRVTPRSRIRVIHNGIAGPVADAPVDPAMRRLKSIGPVICALTGLRPGKGVETLLDALPDVVGPHPSTQLAIWGDGPDLPHLRQRAHRLGIADRVHFLGPTTRPFSAMAGADVFTLPSLAEAFPYVILEAMSVACPIVATDVGGVAEALTPGTGLLVAPGDSAALAVALSALLSDPGRARRLGAAAQQRVRARFTLPRMLTATMEVYGDLVPDFL